MSAALAMNQVAMGFGGQASGYADPGMVPDYAGTGVQLVELDVNAVGRPSTSLEPRSGDWHCEACGTSNFGWRRECYSESCRAPKPKDAESTDSRSGRGGMSKGKERARNQAKREGDWTCCNCGNMNFAWRLACNSKGCDVMRYGNQQYKVAPG